MGIQPDFMPYGYGVGANSHIQKPLGFERLQVKTSRLRGIAIEQLSIPREATRPDTQEFE
jgi:hypothetical protein